MICSDMNLFSVYPCRPVELTAGMAQWLWLLIEGPRFDSALCMTCRFNLGSRVVGYHSLMLRFTNDSPNIVLLIDENYGCNYVGVRVLVSRGNVFFIHDASHYRGIFNSRILLVKYSSTMLFRLNRTARGLQYLGPVITLRVQHGQQIQYNTILRLSWCCNTISTYFCSY